MSITNDAAKRKSSAQVPDSFPTTAEWHIRGFMAEMRGMKHDQIGIYTVMLNLMCQELGRLPDNDGFIAGHCDCGIRYYRKIKQQLLQAGKIFIKDGMIHSSRVILESKNRA